MFRLSVGLISWGIDRQMVYERQWLYGFPVRSLRWSPWQLSVWCMEGRLWQISTSSQYWDENDSDTITAGCELIEEEA